MNNERGTKADAVEYEAGGAQQGKVVQPQGGNSKNPVQRAVHKQGLQQKAEGNGYPNPICISLRYCFSFLDETKTG